MIPENTLSFFRPCPECPSFVGSIPDFPWRSDSRKSFSNEEAYLLPAALQIGFYAFSGDGKATILKSGQTEDNFEDRGLACAVFPINP